MNLLPYSIDKKILKHANTRHRAFYYHYYSSNKDEFRKNVERWKDKKKELIEVLEDINNENLKWQEKDFLDNERDLSGLQLKRFQSEKRLYSLDHTTLNYCIFEMCKFETKQEGEELKKDSIFWSGKINHSIFKNCKFTNISFSEGEFSNIVFYECTFENVDFNKNKDGEYHRLFFQNCTFTQTDFSKVSLKDSCFWGHCVFSDIEYTQETLPQKKIIGKDILKYCKKWDKKTYKTRIENKYIGGPYNKMEILADKDTISRGRIKKYCSLINCYAGLESFYKSISIKEDKHGEHHLYLSYFYIYRWVKDQKEILTTGRLRNFTSFISRYVLGYGVKAERPLLSYLSMIVLFSFVHLFNGIVYGDGLIKRTFEFVPEEFISTIYDFFKSLYFSAITSTTIGYGDIHPGSPITMFLASAQGFIGILLMTMFTVIFGRRFFK